jgi:hypothetical protein
MKMFSLGFWGWGTATGHLIGATDAVEEGRGFASPVFVDIRLRRAGRAPGFQGGAFEGLLGRKRYRWMPTLGNANIVTSKRGVRIACPEAAQHLLDFARDCMERRTRVIFFCACKSPWDAHTCHRREVTRLLQLAARRQDVTLVIEEWPGGVPKSNTIELPVPFAIFRRVARGASAIPLDRTRVPADLAGLPWGTAVTLKSAGNRMVVPVGPAAFVRGSWVLPVFADADLPLDLDRHSVREHSASLRRNLSLS